MKMKHLANTPVNLRTRIANLPRLALSRTRTYLLGKSDLDTIEGRSRERHRRASLSVTASVFSKVLSIFTALVSVPLTLHYLGTERYGMWLTLSALASMLNFADFGIGNGVMNAVAAAYGKGDRRAIKCAASSGLVSLGTICVAMLGLIALGYPWIPWYRIFNVVTPLARSESGPAVAAFLCCVALALPIELVERVQMGVQKSFMATLWRCAGGILSLVAVLVVIWLKMGLVWLVLGFCAIPLLATIANGILFFGRLNPDIRPSFRSANRTVTNNIAQAGILFFLLQILSAVTKYSDNFVIAQMLGAAAVPTYAVPEKLFAQISGTLMMGLWPLWPAYREAMSRGDLEWARNTLKRSMWFSLIYSTTLSALFIVTGPLLIAFWTGSQIHPSWTLLLGLGVWKIMEAASFAMGTFLNAANELKVQVISWGVTAVSSIILEIILIKQMGISGAVWATVIVFGFCCLLPWALYIKRDFSRMSAHS
jgi:O-antigen/teichoic acid export membrane protein